MALGTVLLRPQAFATPPPPTEPSVDALFQAISLLARDIGGDGKAMAVIEAELSDALDRLKTQVEFNIDTAANALKGLLEPLVQAVGGIGADVAGGDPPAMAASGAAMVKLLAGAMRAIGSDHVEATLGRFLDVLEKDLGLDQATVMAAFEGSFDRIVTNLQADIGAADSDPGVLDRFALGGAIQQIRAFAATVPSLPSLGKDTLLPPLIDALKASGIPAMAGKVADQLEKVADIAGPLATVDMLGGVSISASASSNGPKTALKSAPKDPPADTGSSSVTPGAFPSTGSKTAWYATWYTGQRQTTDVDPAGHPILSEVKFGPTLTPSVMEGIAHHSRWIGDAVEVILHAASLERDDVWANVVNMLWRSGDAMLVGFGDIDVPAWGRWLIGGPLTILGSLEGTRFDDAFGLTLMLADWAEALFYARLLWLAREGLLSILTVINGNTERVEGLAYLTGEVMTLLFPGLLALATPGTYGAPQNTGGVQYGEWWVIWYAIAGFLITVATTYLGGFFLTRALAGRWPDTGKVLRLPLRERMLYPVGVSGGTSSAGQFFLGVGTVFSSVLEPIFALVSHLLDFSIYYYLFNEGKTDGGHLPGDSPPGTAVKAAGYPATFAGSPYKLPWPKDASFQCAQGNHGFWSHTPFSFQSQLYAFDFTLDNGDEVLAMRDGIVWNFTEGNATGGSSQNDLFILHDVPIDGFDFDQNGAKVQTIAMYIHEVQNSVTKAFGGTPPIQESQRSITAIVVSGPGPFTIRFTVQNGAAAQPFTVGQKITVANSSVAGINAEWTVTKVGGAVNAWFFEASSPTNPGVPAAPFGIATGIGTRVKQGQLIMLADKAGRAAYNHVHVHVLPMKPDLTGPDIYTIPFVFSDDDVAGDNGVPGSLTYYVSSNVKV